MRPGVQGHAHRTQQCVEGTSNRRPLARPASHYLAYQTCHRRFHQSQRSGLLLRTFRCLAENLHGRGKTERLLAWLHTNRHIIKRWERQADNFLEKFHLPSILTLLSHS
jgi:hypothetical protein